MGTPDKFTSPMNLGNPNEFTIRELAEAVMTVVGSRSTLSSHPLPSDDPRQRQPDITQARTMLDWEPKTVLRDGLVRAIEYLARLLRE